MGGAAPHWPWHWASGMKGKEVTVWLTFAFPENLHSAPCVGLFWVGSRDCRPEPCQGAGLVCVCGLLRRALKWGGLLCVEESSSSTRSAGSRNFLGTQSLGVCAFVSGLLHSVGCLPV